MSLLLGLQCLTHSWSPNFVGQKLMEVALFGRFKQALSLQN